MKRNTGMPQNNCSVPWHGCYYSAAFVHQFARVKECYEAVVAHEEQTGLRHDLGFRVFKDLGFRVQASGRDVGGLRSHTRASVS